MEEKKYQIHLEKGMEEVEVTVREGAAPKLLDPKAPVKINLSGVIGAPAEYLKKRVNTGQFSQQRSHLTVNREKIELTLVVNENDEYERGTVTGKLEYHSKFIEFGINTGKTWMPLELGVFFKMNRFFFTDRKSNMELVTELMNFTASVNAKIEQSAKERGDRSDNFAQTVNSNLPAAFILKIPIFKGTNPETLEVETFARIDGREISFTLFSPGANQTLEEIRDRAIDDQLAQIKEIAPDIAIIEI